MTAPEQMPRCTQCDSPVGIRGDLCARCIADEIDFDDAVCASCHGEGYVPDCFEEFACIDPEGGCSRCRVRCDGCRP